MCRNTHRSIHLFFWDGVRIFLALGQFYCFNRILRNLCSLTSWMFHFKPSVYKLENAFKNPNNVRVSSIIFHRGRITLFRTVCIGFGRVLEKVFWYRHSAPRQSVVPAIRKFSLSFGHAHQDIVLLASSAPLGFWNVVWCEGSYLVII